MLQESLFVSGITREVSEEVQSENDNNGNDGENKIEKTNDSKDINKNKCCDVVIHVCDESRNLEKSFECNRQLLIDKMTYFKQYLNNEDQEDEEEEVDISVHCDILVFEWLIQYISNEIKPKLEIHNVVSILISSHFLQMSVLVTECINFMCNNLDGIIQLPLDLSCLNNEIVTKISNKLNILTIDSLNDPTDKITSRLYRYHLEIFMEKKENKLFFCVYCGELYTKQQRKKLICYKAPVYISFHGQIIRKHCAQRGWYICKYLLGLRLQSYSYKSIYWHLWSITRPPLFCYNCDKYIIIPKLYHCTYHTKQPKIANNKLIYTCCQTKENNFEIIQTEKKGCCHKQHEIISDNNSDDLNCEIEKIFSLISTHSQLQYIFIPFECSDLCSNAMTRINKRFLERPQSADHRSRLLKHSHHKIKKRFSLNSPSKTTGVWDKKYFVFGSQSSSKSLHRNHLNQNKILNFDIYHKPMTFWYDECEEENKNNNDDITEDSFEYLSYLLSFDNIDYGEGDDNCIQQMHDEDDGALFTDDGSVNMEDLLTANGMFLHCNPQNVNVLDESQQTELTNKTTKKDTTNNKKKCKPMPIRGRRLKGITDKDRFSVDAKQESQALASAFGIQQNDIKRLDALMKSLSQNRQSEI